MPDQLFTAPVNPVCSGLDDRVWAGQHSNFLIIIIIITIIITLLRRTPRITLLSRKTYFQRGPNIIIYYRACAQHAARSVQNI